MLQIMSLNLNSPLNSGDAAFDRTKNRMISHLSKLLKRTQKQVIKREETLLDCQQWANVHHRALLLQSNLYRIKKGMAEVTVPDWEQDGLECTLTLDPLTEPKDQIAALFHRAKKLRLGIPYSEKQLQSIVVALTAQQKLISDLHEINTNEALDAFLLTHSIVIPQKHQKIVKKTEPPKPYRTYTSESGLTIWVGKTAKQNDMLTFHHANGSDWWLHAHNYPGSHVVVHCLKKEEKPDQETLRDAAELALRFSKAKDTHDEGEVTVSQVKFLHRIKGFPGKVQVSKHSVMHIRLEPARWNRLRGAL